MEDNLLSRLLNMKTLEFDWLNNWYTFDVARDPTTPPIILEDILKKNIGHDISRSAACNPNCPPEILVEILNRKNEDRVSRNAYRNPSCPPEAKIKWMQETGKIEKEDPKKHIIEYETNKEDDLQDLKDLL